MIKVCTESVKALKNRKIISLLISVLMIIFAFCFSACSSEKTLEGIGKKYKNELITQAKLNSGTSNGDFKVVVLNAEETKIHIENYVFSPNINREEIVAGLFVECKIKDKYGEYIYTVYYNFGLQFESEQTESIIVNYIGWADTWVLDVAKENKTILFEYSIT